MTATPAICTSQKTVSSNRVHPDSINPYLGLRPFTEPDHQFFFGRDHDRDELYRFVRGHVLTILFGASGLGKTSLLSAGLFPLLRSSNYLPIRIELHFGEDHQTALEQVIARIRDEVEAWCVDTPPPDSSKTLWEYFHHTHFWSNKNNQLLKPVLVLDQFEETTRHGHEQDVKEMLNALADLIENRIPDLVQDLLEKTGEELDFDYEVPRVKVIISLREDFLADLEDLKALIPSLSKNRFRLTQMNGEQALEAVIKPAQDKALVTEKVAKEIVRFVVTRGKTDALLHGDASQALAELIVEPSLLSLVCDQLNRRRIKKRLSTITTDLLHRSKGSILSDFYEDSLRDCDEKARQFIEDKLLAKTGFRTSVALEDALKEGVDEQDIDKLVQKRILRLEEHLGHSHVQLMHDRLTGVIGESRRLRQEKQCRLAEQQRREEAFKLEKETMKVRSRQKLNRAYIIGSFILFFLLFISYSLHISNVHRTESVARELRLQSEKLLKSANPDSYVQSLLLATQSLKLVETPEARSAWASAITALPPQSAELTHEEAVDSAVFQSNGGLVTGSGDKVTWWKVDEATQISVAPTKTQILPNGLIVRAFSPDGKLLAATDPENATIWIAHSDMSKPVVQLEHVKNPAMLAFSSSGRYLALNIGDKFVRIFSAEDGKELEKLEHKSRVTSLSFSSDDKYLVTGSSQGIARVWNMKDPSDVKIFLHESAAVAAVLSVSMSADNKYIAIGTSNKWVKNGMAVIWDIDLQLPKQSEPLARFEFEDAVSSVDFHPNNNVLAVMSGDWVSILRIVPSNEASRLQKMMRFPGGIQNVGNRIPLVTFDENGERLITIKGSESRLWEIKAYRHPLSLPDLKSSVTDLEISPDGRYFATVSSGDNLLRLLDIKSRNVVREFSGDSQIMVLSFSADGAQFAAASLDNTVRIWEVNTDKKPLNLDHEELVISINFSPDGHLLASTSGKKAQLWDLRASNDQDPIPLVHDDIVTSATFHPGGQLLATTSGNTALIWDLKTEEIILPPLSHEQPIASVAFDLDGDVLATASGNFVKIWSVETGKSIKSFELDAAVLDVKFSTDGKQFATLRYDNQVIIWDVPSYAQRIQLPHEHLINTGVFSPDGKRFLSATTAYGYSAVWDWPLDTEEMIDHACSVLPWDLSKSDWEKYLKGEDQRQICKNLTAKNE